MDVILFPSTFYSTPNSCKQYITLIIARSATLLLLNFLISITKNLQIMLLRGFFGSGYWFYAYNEWTGGFCLE